MVLLGRVLQNPSRLLIDNFLQLDNMATGSLGI